MQNLSKDLIFNLGQYLSPIEISRLSQVSSDFYYGLNKNHLWIYKLQHDFGILYDFETSSKHGSPKSLYQYIYNKLKEPKTTAGLNKVLTDAITENDRDLFTACLHVGADPSYSSYLDAPNSCKAAILSEQLHTLSYLLRIIPNITQDEINYLFCMAAEQGYVPIVGFLLGSGADDIAGALDSAEATGMDNVIDYLLKTTI